MLTRRDGAQGQGRAEGGWLGESYSTDWGRIFIGDSLLLAVDGTGANAKGDLSVGARGVGLNPDDCVLQAQRPMTIVNIDAAVLRVTRNTLRAGNIIEKVSWGLCGALHAPQREVWVRVTGSS